MGKMRAFAISLEAAKKLLNLWLAANLHRELLLQWSWCKFCLTSDHCNLLRYCGTLMCNSPKITFLRSSFRKPIRTTLLETIISRVTLLVLFISCRLETAIQCCTLCVACKHY